MAEQKLPPGTDLFDALGLDDEARADFTAQLTESFAQIQAAEDAAWRNSQGVVIR